VVGKINQDQETGFQHLYFAPDAAPIFTAYEAARKEMEKFVRESDAKEKSQAEKKKTSSSSKSPSYYSNYYASDNEMAGAAGAMAIGGGLLLNHLDNEKQRRDKLRNGGVAREESISFSRIFSTSALVTGGVLLLDALFFKGAGREKIVSTFKR